MKPNWKTKKLKHGFRPPPFWQTPCVCPAKLPCDESRSLDGRSGATFTIKPVVCCAVLRSRVVNDTTGASVRADRIEKRLWGLDNCYRCRKKRCTWLFQRVNIRYRLPEVLAASGIKPPGLTDRRKGGTGEPVLVECARMVKSFAATARTCNLRRGKTTKRSTRKVPYAFANRHRDGCTRSSVDRHRKLAVAKGYTRCKNC